MPLLRRLAHSTLLLYVLMLLPARILILGLFDSSWYYAHMMHASGVWSVRILVLAIAVSPILAIIKRIGHGQSIGRWLMRKRRHFGLISFIYAALHMIHYLLETVELSLIWFDLFRLEYAAGWIGFVIFALLAVTSNSYSTRRLGQRWKVLHNGIYLAAAATFLHWYLFDYFADQVGFWVAIFIGLKLVQFLVRKFKTAGVT